MDTINMLTIGQLAKATGTTSVTIRYYERQGLIAPSKRSKGGYRLYPDSIIPRFYFIKNAKSVGFTLDEIKELLSLQQKKNIRSRAVKDLTLSKVDEIKNKINALNRMKKALSTWADACDGKVPLEECPILENLYQPNIRGSDPIRVKIYGFKGNLASKQQTLTRPLFLALRLQHQ